LSWCGLWSLRGRVGYKGLTWLVVVLVLWCLDLGRDRCCRPEADRVPAAGVGAAGVELAGGLGPAAGVVVLGVLVVLAAIVGGVLAWRSHASGDGDRRDAAERFAMAWTRGGLDGDVAGADAARACGVPGGAVRGGLPQR
jgi:hypothetical protein